MSLSSLELHRALLPVLSASDANRELLVLKRSQEDAVLGIGASYFNYSEIIEKLYLFSTSVLKSSIHRA